MQAHPTERTHPDLSGQVAVVDGYGVTLSVQRGHLVIRDGSGSQRRERRFNRATCPVQRILILGHAGSISLEALRWCCDLGIGVAQIDSASGLVFTSARRETGATRIRRVQALAPYTEVGVEIAQLVFGEKLRGQAGVAQQLRGGEAAATAILSQVERVAAATTLADTLAAESLAAFSYWQSWASAVVRFDTQQVPEHWLSFGLRSAGRTDRRRHATNPANALLNYTYALLEAETTLALHAAGLDPALGIWHVDERLRESLSLDVMEASRPVVDAYILDLLRDSTFRQRDFHETREGVCRILPPLTHVLADALPILREQVAPIVGAVATLLDRTISPSDPARLKFSRRTSGHSRLKPAAAAKLLALPVLSHCRGCGSPFPPGSEPTTAYCPNCLDQLATSGELPRRPGTRSPVTARHRQALSARTKATVAWNRANPDPPDLAIFNREIRPHLDRFTLSELSRATGLSRRYLKLIRDDRRTPHAMHWDAFRAAIQVRITPRSD